MRIEISRYFNHGEKSVISLIINGHFPNDYCIALSSAGQCIQWIAPDLFYAFENGRTIFIADDGTNILILERFFLFLKNLLLELDNVEFLEKKSSRFTYKREKDRVVLEEY